MSAATEAAGAAAHGVQCAMRRDWSWALPGPHLLPSTHHQQAERGVWHQPPAHSVLLGPGQLQSIHRNLQQNSKKSRLRCKRAQDTEWTHFTWGGRGGQGDVGKKGWEFCLGRERRKRGKIGSCRFFKGEPCLASLSRASTEATPDANIKAEMLHWHLSLGSNSSFN